MRPIQVVTELAPSPVGTYSQAIKVNGLIFLAGQTPRDRAGNRLSAASFDLQVSTTLDNLEEIAKAAGSSLHHAVKINVFLKDTRFAADFDRIYAGYVGNPPPARTLTQSNLLDCDVEVDAILTDPFN
jgi:2-iminobutanoate/2-iminopropanoate deaminase